jgi:hypothetical protein
MMLAMSGMKTPAATKALILFSKTSAISSGFFRAVGSAAPAVILQENKTDQN